MLNAKKGETTGLYSVSFLTNKCDSWNLPTNELMQFQCRNIQWELSLLVLRKNPIETDNLQNTELSYEK